MNNIANKDFNVLEADGSNYLTWAMDVKIILSSKGFTNAINEASSSGPAITDLTKYDVLHFLRHHLHPDLKMNILWRRTLELFGLHSKTVMAIKRP